MLNFYTAVNLLYTDQKCQGYTWNWSEIITGKCTHLTVSIFHSKYQITLRFQETFSEINRNIQIKLWGCQREKHFENSKNIAIVSKLWFEINHGFFTVSHTKKWEILPVCFSFVPSADLYRILHSQVYEMWTAWMLMPHWLTWAWTPWWVWRSARLWSVTMTSSWLWERSASSPSTSCKSWQLASQVDQMVLLRAALKSARRKNTN